MADYKRFMIFAYDNYYPFGGLDDCIESFDTIEDLKKRFTISEHSGLYMIYDNSKVKELQKDIYKIFDRIEGVKVEVKDLI